MTKERFEELQHEIAKLKEIDNKKTERVARELDEMIEVPCSKEQDEVWANISK
tara:strand:+ start:214 stop:372 length:159 start_codon:yes stop_codon:yes gene_type:complete